MQPCQQEKNIEKIQSTLDENAKSEIKKEGRLVRIEEKLTSIEEKIDQFIEQADNKYAPKWVANLVYGLLAGGALYVLQAVLRSAGLK